MQDPERKPSKYPGKDLLLIFLAFWVCHYPLSSPIRTHFHNADHLTAIATEALIDESTVADIIKHLRAVKLDSCAYFIKLGMALVF